MLKRKDDWPERLRAFFFAAAERRFSWGSFNCCTFACDGVEAMTGDNPAERFVGKVKDKRSAFVALKKFAGGSVLETAEKIAAEMGVEEIPVLMAGRGDVVYLETDEGGALGLVDLSGVHAVFLSPDDDLSRRPISECARAWRIE